MTFQELSKYFQLKKDKDAFKVFQPNKNILCLEEACFYDLLLKQKYELITFTDYNHTYYDDKDYCIQDFENQADDVLNIIKKASKLVNNNFNLTLNWCYYGLSISDISDVLYDISKGYQNHYEGDFNQETCFFEFLRFIHEHENLNFYTSTGKIFDIFIYRVDTSKSAKELLLDFWTGRINVNGINLYDFAECFVWVDSEEHLLELISFIKSLNSIKNF